MCSSDLFAKTRDSSADESDDDAAAAGLAPRLRAALDARFRQSRTAALIEAGSLSGNGRHE